jgi:hypothetical protein
VLQYSRFWLTGSPSNWGSHSFGENSGEQNQIQNSERNLLTLSSAAKVSAWIDLLQAAQFIPHC